MTRTTTRIDNPRGIPLPPATAELLGGMFGSRPRIVVDAEFGGGFSGSRVLRVVPYDPDGRPELPSVVKLGPADQIAREAAAYRDHVRGRLSGTAEVWGDAVIAEDADWAGLRYALVGSGLFQIESLGAFCRHAEQGDLVQVIEDRLFVHLGAVWRYARLRPDVSIREAGYDRLLSERIRGALAAALGDDVDLDAPLLTLPHRPETRVPNPLTGLALVLENRRPMRFGTIHGDLNLENVLVDPVARTVRMIDFAQSGEGHVLLDPLRLETAVLTHLISDALVEAELPASAAYDLLIRLHADAGSTPLHPALSHLQLTLALIRRAASPQLGTAGDWQEYYDGLTVCLLGASKYRELGPSARQAAFWAAAAARQLAVEGEPANAEALAGAVQVLLARDPTAEAVPHNLPLAVTSFVGREREIDAVKALVGEHRLVTLTGVGGTGKTRLALRVAGDVCANYPDGAWFVDLAPLEDPELVARSAAAALRLREEPGRPIEATLADHLGSKRLLLILDNCEHLIEACARLADGLLRAAPDLRILATSRELLGLPGEAVHVVPPLATPEDRRAGLAWDTRAVAALAETDGVRLFSDRARTVRPEFALTDENAGAVARIVRRLDGIPLAIELAAARMRALAVADIALRLDQRFRLLNSGSRTAPGRQQTLRGAIDWSYALLGETERVLFMRLAVFRGGWTLDAAEAVCAEEPIGGWEVLDLMAHLVDKSLVIAEDVGGGIRYRYLETVREYAREALEAAGETKAAQRRHLDYCLALVGPVEASLTGREAEDWLRRVEPEHDNLRAALDRCLAAGGDAEAGLRLAAPWQMLWRRRGHFAEGRLWLERTLDAAPSAAPELRAYAHIIAGHMALPQGDYVAAKAHYEACRALRQSIGDELGIGLVLGNLGGVAARQGDEDAAGTMFEDSLAIARKHDDRRGIAVGLMNVGVIAQHRHDYARARALDEESLAIWRERGEGPMVAAVIENLAIVYHHEGDLDAARRMFDECLALRRELGDRAGIAQSLSNRAELAREQGDTRLARALLLESLEIWRAIGGIPGGARALSVLGQTLLVDGHFEPAARFLAVAAKLREATHTVPASDEQAIVAQAVAKVRSALGDAAFEAAWALGAAMDLDEAVAYANAALASPPPEAV